MDLSTWTIDYGAILDAVGRPDSATPDALSRELSAAWTRAYRRSAPHVSRICVINIRGYKYIFDDARPDTQPEEFDGSDLICERVVAVYGHSQSTGGEARRASRIRGFPRGAASAPEVVGAVHHDRGHMMAHASGGGEDINLFPQLTEVNQGQSRQGKSYRAMERLLAANPGTFCFSRPIYSGPTDHPYVVEFGLLEPDGALRVEQSLNCRSTAEMLAIEKAVADRMRSGKSE